MTKIAFTKAIASGNDFVIIDNRANHHTLEWSSFALKVCNRKTGIGADGLLVLEASDKADVKMRILNPDGSEVSMCGNGSRCVTLYCKKSPIRIETIAGILEGELPSKNRARVKMTDPFDLKKDLDISLDGKAYKVHYVNTGVPHVVYFTNDIESFDVTKIGKAIRYYKDFQPDGTNADFVKVLDKQSISVRTYERGVEDETLACGTGATASAIIASVIKDIPSPVDVKTKSGETLTISFDKAKDDIRKVYLEGEVRLERNGEIDL